MQRRRLFGLAGGAAATTALPAVAAPVVETHANDVMPLITIRRPIREQTFGFTLEQAKAVLLETNRLYRQMVERGLVRDRADG